MSPGKCSNVLKSAANQGCLAILFNKRIPARLGAEVESATRFEGVDASSEAPDSECSLTGDDGNGKVLEIEM